MSFNVLNILTLAISKFVSNNYIFWISWLFCPQYYVSFSLLFVCFGIASSIFNVRNHNPLLFNLANLMGFRFS